MLTKHYISDKLQQTCRASALLFLLIVLLIMPACQAEAQWTQQKNTSGMACPEVRIAQKYDHTPMYSHLGWDTVVNCSSPTIELTCDPFIPVQYFNGTYTVEEIPFNPPDTTFYLGGQGQKVPITSDDQFSSPVSLPFPFYFFGIRKNQFRIGDNGLITFVSDSLFQLDGAGNYCPYQFSAPIPWTATTTGKPNLFNRTHDAIYGVYEDTYFGPSGSYISGNQGIYYGILDEFPCRKIIASWNEIPVYNNPSVRQSYQIVGYEGSNIVEVHIKRRGCCPSTSSAVIGIQNATGQPQVPGNSGEPNQNVQNGAPAAFWPTDRNAFTSTIDSVSYRFSPQGTTNYTEQWYRIFDDGRDSVDLPNIDVNPTALLDTNGYYYTIAYSATQQSHARAVVSPTSTAHYVYRLRFQDAEGVWYDLHDTITVGVDTANSLSFVDTAMNVISEITLCYGEVANIALMMDTTHDTLQLNWSATHTSGGTTVSLPTSSIHPGTITIVGSNRLLPLTINTTELYNGTAPTKIDSIFITCSVEYTNHCTNYRQLILRILPSATVDTVANQCDSFYWYGNTYYSSTIATHQIGSSCNIKRLTLTIQHSSDTVDTLTVCPNRPYIYDSVDYGGPGTYDVTLTSTFGCDSVVHVTLLPYDSTYHLSPMVSLGNDHSTRREDASVWLPYDTTLTGCLPSLLQLQDSSTAIHRNWTLWNTNGLGDTVSDTTALFNTTVDSTGVFGFQLIATSPEGCQDTVRNDTLLYVFTNPTSDFLWEPDIVPFHDPQLTLSPKASPADSLTYRWLIATTAGGSYDTVHHDERQEDGLWHYSWEPLVDSGHYDVALVAYWTHTLDRISGTDTLTVSATCTDTAHHPVLIVNTFLQFPSLVTPNGDGINDTWEVANLVEMGQYPINEVWIYNHWGALVFHARDIRSHDDCWDPNATNSPDGTYFFRFSGKGRYGIVKQNGVIEVLRTQTK